MYCKKCGAEIQDESIPCPGCGVVHKPKKKFYKKWWFWAIIATVILAGMFGNMDDEEQSAGGGGTASATTTVGGRAEATEAPTTVVTTAPAPDYIEIDPAGLMAAYLDNEVAADAAYKNKQIKMTGTVKSINKDVLGNVYVTIETGVYLHDIDCYFAKQSEIDKVAELHTGDTITIIGKCTGLSFYDVDLEYCVFS